MSEIFTREQAKASDKVLHDLMLVVARKDQGVVFALTSLHYAAGDSKRGYSTSASWNLSHNDALAKAKAIVAADEGHTLSDGRWIPSTKGEQAARAIEGLDKAEAELADAVAAKTAQDSEWINHGQWDRYSVVPGGHIHTDLRCFTFRHTTDVRWAYPVSGDSVDEAIAEYGPALCTHCFPNAPVEQYASKVEVDEQGNPISRREAEAARAARKAEKDAKLAAKNAKRVLDPHTGTDLEGPDGYELKTEIAVSRAILAALEDIRYYGADKKHYSASRRDNAPTYGQWVTYAVAALAAKRGVDEAELLAEFKAKDAKKARRN